MLQITKPYLLFLAEEQDETNAKTAMGLRDWAPDDCVGQWGLPGCTIDLGLPTLRPAEAYDRGARSLLVGVAPVGGAIPDSWLPALLEALDAGLDIVSGMHTRLVDIPVLRERAEALGRNLHDVRHAGRSFPIATGRKRSGKRLLTVGTDCALGKKYTALAITRELQRRGIKADFRATGQTGVMISGGGVAIDAVVADFIAGAAETLSPDNDADHWDVIEGQGSLFHPAYAGVTLGLLHGSQPDAFVLCHDPTRRTLSRYPDFPLPSLRHAVEVYLTMGRVTNRAIRCVGIALNTSRCTEEERARALAAARDETGLPAFDPLKDGVGAAVDLLETI